MLTRVICIIGFLWTFIPGYSQWEQAGGPTGALTWEIYRVDGFLFVNGEAGGIFRSADNGASWQALKNGLPNYPHCYAFSVSGSKLYAAIAESGIYVSENDGESWSFLSSDLAGKTFYALKVEGGLMYAGYSEGGLYFSADGGAHWKYFPHPGSQQIRVLEKTGSNLWIGADVLYKSADNGETWAKVNIAAGPSGLLAIGITGNNIYATGYAMNGSSALFTSRDLGSTWSQSSLPSDSPMSIFCSGKDVYIGDLSCHVIYSFDEAVTWTQLNSPIPGAFINPINAIYKEGNRLYVTTDDGAWVSDDHGTSWLQKSVGLTNHIIRNIAISDNAIIAESERQGVFVSLDQGITWQQRNNGITGLSGLSTGGIYTHQGKVFIGNGSGVFVSNNLGLNWDQKLSLEVNLSIRSLCGSGSRLVASSSKGCYLSSDEGDTWALKGVGVLDNRDLMTSLASGDTIVMATYNEVFISTDAGDSWKTSAVTGSFFTPTDILFYKSALFLSTWQGLFYSNDLGASWNQVGGGLPGIIVDLASNDSTIFAGTESGLFLSKDQGSSWLKANTNLYNQNVYSFVADSLYGYVGTYGSSVWRILLSTLTAPCALPQTPNLTEHCGTLSLSNYTDGNITWFQNSQPSTQQGTSSHATGSGWYYVVVSNPCGAVQSNLLGFDETELGHPPVKPEVELNCGVLSILNTAGNNEITWYMNDVPIPDQHGRSLQLTDTAYYKAEIKNDCGNASSDIFFSGGKRDFTIYNVITPNGDNVNDVYKLDEALVGSSLKVYNRWGMLVFQSQSYQNDWKESDLSTGVYFYIIENACYGTFKGTISVF